MKIYLFLFAAIILGACDNRTSDEPPIIYRELSEKMTNLTSADDHTYKVIKYQYGDEKLRDNPSQLFFGGIAMPPIAEDTVVFLKEMKPFDVSYSFVKNCEQGNIILVQDPNRQHATLRITAKHLFDTGVLDTRRVASVFGYNLSEVNDVAYKVDTLTDGRQMPSLKSSVDLEGQRVVLRGWRGSIEDSSSLQYVEITGVAHMFTPEMQKLSPEDLPYGLFKDQYFMRSDLAADQPVNGVSGSPVYLATDSLVPVGVFCMHQRVIVQETGERLQTYLWFTKLDLRSLETIVEEVSKSHL